MLFRFAYSNTVMVTDLEWPHVSTLHKCMCEFVVWQERRLAPSLTGTPGVLLALGSHISILGSVWVCRLGACASVQKITDFPWLSV